MKQAYPQPVLQQYQETIVVNISPATLPARGVRERELCASIVRWVCESQGISERNLLVRGQEKKP